MLSYNEYKPRSFEAGPDWPGIAWSEDSQVTSDIRAARAAGTDLVIPFMHWGWERELAPTERQRQLARLMIDAGADLVVGGHPHVTQGAEYYRGKLIVYSLGNFVFDGFDAPAEKRLAAAPDARPPGVDLLGNGRRADGRRRHAASRAGSANALRGGRNTTSRRRRKLRQSLMRLRITVLRRRPT